MLETQQAWIRTLVLALDLCGTFVFALSGAAVGIRHKLDLFGVLVLSFVAATAGGITRDVLLGATPPAQSSTGGIRPSPSSRRGAPTRALRWRPQRKPRDDYRHRHYYQ